MENFDWSSYTKIIAVKATLSDIYSAWTKASELERWFLKKVVFYDSEKRILNHTSNVSKGLYYEWHWYIYEEPMLGKVIDTNGTDFIRFTFEGECLVDINLNQMDEYVVIKLRHYNIPEDNHSKQYVRLGCTNGWTFYLTNLKSVYEGGIDLRNKEDKLGVMINN